MTPRRAMDGRESLQQELGGHCLAVAIGNLGEFLVKNRGSTWVKRYQSQSKVSHGPRTPWAESSLSRLRDF